VRASGCFGPLHPGHIRLPEHACTLGDILVVAIESDLTAGNAVRIPPEPGYSATRLIEPILERRV
jgi:cytidyltransferase-like protein